MIIEKCIVDLSMDEEFELSGKSAPLSELQDEPCYIRLKDRTLQI